MLAANAMSSAPALSVIVLNHNGGTRLSAALESVWAQRVVQPEIIVVDHGSSDSSRAWLEQHRDRVANLVLVSDTNLYAAANRGIAAAHGEWVFFLRSRDRLVGDTVLSECLNWMRKTEAGVVAGEAATDDGRIMKLHSRVNAVAGDFVPSAGVFYRRSIFSESGEFDATLSRMAAYDLHVRLWKSRVRFKPIPIRVTACEARSAAERPQAREVIRARHRYFGALRCLPWDVLTLLRSLKPARSQPS